MHVFINNRQKDLPLSHERKKISKIVELVLQLENTCFDEVAIRFVPDRVMCALHEEFFNDPSSTDCISFPIDNVHDVGYKLLGEIVICPKTAIEYAKKYKKEVYEEVT